MERQSRTKGIFDNSVRLTDENDAPEKEMEMDYYYDDDEPSYRENTNRNITPTERRIIDG